MNFFFYGGFVLLFQAACFVPNICFTHSARTGKDKERGRIGEGGKN